MAIYFVASSIVDFDEERNGTGYWEDRDNYSGSVFCRTTSTARPSLWKSLGSTLTGETWFTLEAPSEITYYAYDTWDTTYPPSSGLLAIWDAEENPILFLGPVNSSSTLEGKVYLRDGSVQTLVYGSFSEDVSPKKFDVRIEPGVGFSVYLNRVLLFDYTGDVGNAASTVNGVGAVSVGYSDEGTSLYVRNVLVADFDTRYAKVYDDFLSTTPAVNTSSSGNPSVIPNNSDGNTLSQMYASDGLLFNSAGSAVMYARGPAFTLENGYAIAGVALTFAAFKLNTSVVPNAEPTLEVSGTNYTVATEALTETVKPYSYILEQSPATNSSWQESEIDALKVGLYFRA